MCGICGIIKSNNSIDVDQLLAMTGVLRHRGPDDEGFILSGTDRNIIKAFYHDETIDSIQNKTKRLENNMNANLGFGFRGLYILISSSIGINQQILDGKFWKTTSVLFCGIVLLLNIREIYVI